MKAHVTHALLHIAHACHRVFVILPMERDTCILHCYIPLKSYSKGQTELLSPNRYLPTVFEKIEPFFKSVGLMLLYWSRNPTCL